MKRKIFKLLTVPMAVIFLFNNFAYAKTTDKLMDSRTKAEGSEFPTDQTLVMRDTRGKVITRPSAYFKAMRCDKNGNVLDEVYSTGLNDDGTPYYTPLIEVSDEEKEDEMEGIPKLYCNVGDTLKFEDLSIANNTYYNSDDHIAGWDWQYWGDIDCIGSDHVISDSNIVNSSEYTITDSGTTRFFLCVKSSTKPSITSDWAWSVNGTHRSLGQNEKYTKGIYWYFAELMVVAYDPVQINYIDGESEELLTSEEPIPVLGGKNSYTIETPMWFNGVEYVTDEENLDYDTEYYVYDHCKLLYPDGSLYGEANGGYFELRDTKGNYVPYRTVNIYMYTREHIHWTAYFINAATSEVMETREWDYQDVEHGLNYTISPREGFTYIEHIERFPDGTEKFFYNGKGQISRTSAELYIYYQPDDISEEPVQNDTKIPEEKGNKHMVNYIDVNTNAVLKTDAVEHGSLYAVLPIDDYTYLYYKELHNGIEGESNTNRSLFVNSDINAYFESYTTDDEITVKYIDIETDKVLETDTVDVGDEYEIEDIPHYKYLYYKPVENGVIGAEHSNSSFTAERGININAYFLADGDDTGDNCVNEYTWKEKYIHYITIDSDTTKKCTHTHTYKATLTAVNETLSPTVFKAGYSFKNNVKLTVKVEMTKYKVTKDYCKVNTENRAPEATIYLPTNVTLDTGFVVQSMNRGNQERYVGMTCEDDIDTGGYHYLGSKTLTFVNAANPISVLGSEAVFTPVSLPDGNYTYDVYIDGGKIVYTTETSTGSEKTTVTCLSLALDGADAGKYTIKGDMYEDDSTNAT